MDWKKRAAFGSLFLGIITLVFFSGLFVGKMYTSNKGSDELKEIKEVLKTYYYDDIDVDAMDVAALKGAVDSLNDPYTYYYDKKVSIIDGYYIGLGIGVIKSSDGYIIASMYKNSPCKQKGLLLGDLIYGVDEKIYPTYSLDDIEVEMSGNLGDIKKFYVRRGKRDFTVDVTISTIDTTSVSSRMIGTVGYLKIDSFESYTYDQFKIELNKLEQNSLTGLIIDVRNNPGGLLSSVTSILREFMTGDKAFAYTKNVKNDSIDQYKPTKIEKKPYDIKVLVNENSASASEVFALAMNRVMNYDLIGKLTFGKGVFQTDYTLSSKTDTYLHITIGYWYGYDMESINKKGIEPTIEIDPFDYVTVLPPIDKTYAIDTADDEIKNIQLMLKALGYEIRTDGYFDIETKNILESNYSSQTLTYNVMKSIYEDYSEEITKDIHDAQLMKAINLLND